MKTRFKEQYRISYDIELDGFWKNNKVETIVVFYKLENTKDNHQLAEDTFLKKFPPQTKIRINHVTYV